MWAPSAHRGATDPEAAHDRDQHRGADLTEAGQAARELAGIGPPVGVLALLPVADQLGLDRAQAAAPRWRPRRPKSENGIAG